MNQVYDFFSANPEALSGFNMWQGTSVSASFSISILT